MIPVAEIFGPTIQGEGPDVGLKSIFLRVVGCDFNCIWCDSKFAWKVSEDTVKYEESDLANILVTKCKETNCFSVILTGGNPCLYDFKLIVKELHKNNIKVAVETQGSILPNWLKEVDTLVISPKAPSSNQKDVLDGVEDFINRRSNPTGTVAIKIPIFNEEDFKFAETYYHTFESTLDSTFKFYLSVGNTDIQESGDISPRILNSYENLINRVINSNMKKVYVLPQVHTLIWGNKQGV